MGARNVEARGSDPVHAVRNAPAPAQSGTHRRVLVRPVLEHPHPLLSRPSVEVDPRSIAVVALANLLAATMPSSPGCIGLSAPQIGENVRVFAMDVSGHRKMKSCVGLVVLVNPRILSRSGTVVMREGCLSVPQLTGDVVRASQLIVSGAIPGSGRNVAIPADGIEARCILHEIDHLDGILFVDRVVDPVAHLFPRKTYA